MEFLGGELPSGFMEALKGLKQLQWSLPALVLLALTVMIDFSHTLADKGLDFVPVTKRGEDLPVLVIASDKRNHNRPLQTVGWCD